MDITELEAFMAERKALQELQGTVPQWEAGSRKGELSATWNVSDKTGIFRAQLRFRCPRHSPQHSSISLICRGAPLTRVDLVPSDECKPNPLGAAEFGLLPRVCGS